MSIDHTNHLPIAVLGAGSWGTALALYLSRMGQVVRLWEHNSKQAAMLSAERVNNRYMPGHIFPELLHPTSDIAKAIDGVSDILIAVPSTAFQDTLLALKPLLDKPTHIIWATKGIDSATGKLLHDAAHDTLGEQHEYAALSGPSFAREVAAGLPTAIVAASNNPDFLNHIVSRFNSPLLRVYTSTDITGVEASGIVKNVLAIATGISDGMGFGANARSALITRGLAEMTRLGIALGGRQETFVGLAGVGDLILTCTDNQSRNRRFGLALGKGQSPQQAEKEIGQVVEGKQNAELVIRLAHQHKIDMPITEGVWNILRGQLTPLLVMQGLLAREPKKEV